MPKISIIIPIYNVGEYLNKTVQSVVNQTLQDIEIILVDDASKDNSPQLVDEWAARDTRIVPIHKQNAGVTEARKTGLAAAKSEYIFYLDGDDYITPDSLRQLYEAAEERHADWVVSDFLIEYLDGHQTEKRFKNFGVVDAKGFLAYSYGKADFYFTGRLIRKSLLTESVVNVPKEVTYGEDNMMVTQLGAQLQCACKVDCFTLIYVQRESSVTNKKKINDLHQRARACRLCYDYLCEKPYFGEIKPDVDAYFAREYFACIARGYVDDEMRFVMNDCKGGGKRLAGKGKLFFTLAKVAPKLSVSLYQLMKTVKSWRILRDMIG